VYIDYAFVRVWVCMRWGCILWDLFSWKKRGVSGQLRVSRRDRDRDRDRGIDGDIERGGFGFENGKGDCCSGGGVGGGK